MNGFSMFSILERSTGRWVGRGGPFMSEGWPGTEVGWGVAADAQRKGYAKEAATAAIDWAFSSLGWSEVIHCISPDNAASIATARSLGSVLRQNRRRRSGADRGELGPLRSVARAVAGEAGFVTQRPGRHRGSRALAWTTWRNQRSFRRA